MSEDSARYALAWAPQSPVADGLQLKVGSGLVSIFDPEQGGVMLEKIKQIRRELAEESAMSLPPVRIQDDFWLQDHEYELLILGESAGCEEAEEHARNADAIAVRLKQMFLAHRSRITSLKSPADSMRSVTPPP